LTTVLLWSGCAHLNHEEFGQLLTAEEESSLYQPLTAGKDTLLDRLDSLDTEATIFTLSPGGAQRVEGSLDPGALPTEDHIIFMKSITDEGIRWMYFNPRYMGLEFLDDAAQTHDDLVHTGPNSFTLFRALVDKVKKPFGKEIVHLFRFDFELHSENGPACTDYRKLTEEPGIHLSPIPLPEVKQLLFLQRDDEELHRLMRVDFGAGIPLPLFQEEAFDVQYPRLLRDGRLVFAANPEGAYNLYQIDQIEERLQAIAAITSDQPPWLPDEVMEPFDYQAPIEQEATPDSVLLPIVVDGQLQPELLRFPEAYDLEVLCALTQTHNPYVNEKRLLLASAMLESAQARLPNWPRINLGVDYESAVEVFYSLPQIFTGDTISQDIVHGLLGFVQPLLDFNRNKAISEAALWKGRLAGDLVDNEINERVAEMAGLYFEAQYLKRKILLEAQLLQVTGQRYIHYKKLRDKGEALRLQLLAVEQVMEGLRSERAFHVKRLEFLKSRIREVAGLPEAVTLRLVDERFRFQDYQTPSLQELRDMALLNHPAALATRHALSQAWYHKKTGPDIRTTANFTGDYNIGRREYDRLANTTDPVTGAPLSNLVRDSRIDETVTLGLNAQIPLAGRKAKRLHGQWWDAHIDSLRLVHESTRRGIAVGMEEAYVDFSAAQRDDWAKRASREYYLEKLRVTRLHSTYAPADSPVTVSRLPDVGGAKEEVLLSDILAPLTARYEYLEAQDRVYKVEMDLGLRFARLWREMGLSRELTGKAREWNETRRSAFRPAIWLWRTVDVLASDQSMQDFVVLAREQQVKRVYTYLYSDSRLLLQRTNRERLTVFLNACDRWDIEVWGLLGEPEWLTGNNETALITGLNRIAAFNEDKALWEPRIQGVKLDLEPHALPDWDTKEESRVQLNSAYLGLLDAARKHLSPHLPLWVDCPVKFWQPRQAALLKKIQDRVDGITVMCYFNSENAIRKWAAISLEQSQRPLEVGLELSSQAPETDRMTEWKPELFKAFQNDFTRQNASQDAFAGLALHDYEGMKSYFSGEQVP
jgi:outer membrane protein TolC